MGTASDSVEQLEIIEALPPGGGGRTLLFVHGAFAGAWCWAEYFLPYFAKQGFRACAVSLSGHGSSPGRERLDWLSIADYVRDLEQAEQAARYYGTEAEIFPGMGHVMMLETDWQKVADRIIAWLRAGGLDRA